MPPETSALDQYFQDYDLDGVNSLELENQLDSLVRGETEKLTGNSHAELKYLLELLQAYNKRKEDTTGAKWFTPGTPFSIENCPRHRAFFRAGKLYQQRVFLAGNRIGKTVSGGLETSFHATGEYPDWWEGRVFDEPVNAWACGKTGQTTRDTVQRELFGPIGMLGSGSIPKDKIVKVYSRPGVPNGIDTAVIKHRSGGHSVIGMKSYDQNINAFVGWTGHVIWCDEEVPLEIYNECLIRVMTTNGIIYVTFTPIAGITPFILNFCKDADYLEGAKKIITTTGREDRLGA